MVGVFRKYDIRGKYPNELNDEIAYRVGRALVIRFGDEPFAIGYDHRKSSPSLHESVIRGITDQGADVVDIGFCSSPELYNYNVSKSLIGVMITASHNPPEYNGIKVNNYDGRMINYKAGLEEVEEILKREIEESSTKGKVTKIEHNEKYVNYLKSFLKKPNRKIKIVVDTGNGVAGPTVEKIFSDNKDVEIVPLYFEPDGNYPNHEANPADKKNLVDLSEKIRETNADFGAAFDGDGDRCLFLDERGAPISPDIFFCVIMDFENKVKPKGTYYFDLWFSKVVKERVKELGCSHQVLPLGAANFREKLVSSGGIVASEVSAHVMFAENYSQDDGFFMLIKAINYYTSTNKTMSALVAPYLTYFNDSLNIVLKENKEIFEKVKERYSDAKISELDGVTVEYKDWWFNVRKSNTEPVIRIRIEADTREMLEQKKTEVKDFINQI